MVAPKKTIQSNTDGRVVLRSIPWNMYESLLATNQDQAGVRFYYDNGILEIKMPSLPHENPNRKLARLVEVLTEEMRLDIEPAGSTTFKREDLRKGFEPDSCYSIQHAEAIRGKEPLDLRSDPAPDLVIEIDISSDSLDKFPIFADLRVPEVWRFDGSRVSF
jgi:Uma2 family endonuclease